MWLKFVTTAPCEHSHAVRGHSNYTPWRYWWNANKHLIDTTFYLFRSTLHTRQQWDKNWSKQPPVSMGVKAPWRYWWKANKRLIDTTLSNKITRVPSHELPQFLVSTKVTFLIFYTRSCRWIDGISDGITQRIDHWLDREGSLEHSRRHSMVKLSIRSCQYFVK